MSIISTFFSSRSSSRINARIAFFMDNLFAIGFGLGLRFVVDNVSHHDFRIAGTLIGLWEGVVTLHFLKKMPKSSDPYIAYAVRLFVDFLATESLTRLVLVIIWTGMGMVLADITPAIWHDVGGHRIWRRFRRDMYYISRSIPRLPPLFPRARVVRFSPVIEPTEISETMSTFSPTADTPTITSQAPTTRVVPPTPAVSRVQKRPVPGGLPSSAISETDTELGSVLGLRPGAGVGTSHIRYTVRPRRPSTDSGTPTPSSVDDSNLSSDVSSVSASTISQPIEIEGEIEVPVRRLDKGKGKEHVVEKDDSDTPTQRPIDLPPTPSDSNRPHPDRTSFIPTINAMPSIPDFYESGLGSDWENIRKEEVERPPTPPQKDFDSPPVHHIPPPSVYEPTPRPSNFDQDLWDSVSNAAPPTPYTRTSPKRQTSRLPPTTSMAPTSIPVIPKSVKKKSEPPPPPPVPQTPLYGADWDTEKDKLPPPTPSVLARTLVHDQAFGLNNNEAGVPPADSVATPPAEHGNPEHGNPEPAPAPDASERQQGGPVPNTGFDEPWTDFAAPPQPQDGQKQESQPEVEPIQPAGPPTPQSKPTTPPTPQQSPSKIPPTPQQKSGTVPFTPLQQPKTMPTPHQQTKTVPPTPQQQTKTVPPTPQQQTKTVPPTPQPQTKTVPPTPQQQTKTVPPTPQQQTKTVPPTPRHPAKTVPSTPQPPQLPATQNLFDDITQQIDDLGGGSALGVGGSAPPQQQQQARPEGDLVDLGDDDGNGNGGTKTPEDVGANGGTNGENNGEDTGEDPNTGDVDPQETEPVQVDERNNPLSPTSSAYSSVAGVPPEIKERNKQAIIIRAQIAELTKRIEELKAEKLKAEGREELDPLSEESTLKQQEIEKAERSLEKLRKRAEKRHQAAIESTQYLTVPRTLTLNFTSATADEVATRLEDVIGLFFGPDRKNIGLSLMLPKAGPGKAVKAAVTKVFEEYGLKTTAKMGGMSVNMAGQAYIDMVVAFRHKHAKADES